MDDSQDLLLHQYIETQTIPNDQNISQILNSQTIKILHMNIRSLRKNIDQFSLFLESISQQIEVIVLTEAFINKDITNFHLPSYDCITKGGSLTKNEGVAIYYKKYLKINSIEHNLSDCTSIMLNIADTQRKYNLNLLGIYRTPSIRDPEPFINSLGNLIKHHSPTVVGDININIKDDSSPYTDSYLNMFSEHGYISCINDHTRTTESTESCIDHIFIPNKLYDNRIIALNIQTSITDHFSQIICLPLAIPTKKIQHSITKTTSIKIDYKQLNIDLSTETWTETLQEEDPNRSYTEFITKFDEHIQRNTTKTISNTASCRTRRLKPWMTEELIKNIRYRDKLHEISKKQPYNTVLKAYKNNFTKMIKLKINKTKENYFQNKLFDAGTDLRKTWSIVNEITNNKQTKPRTIESIVVNNIEMHSKIEPKKIANAFNDHYIEIGHTLAKGITKMSNATDLLLNSIPVNNKTIFLTPTSESEIENIIKNLKNSHSTGEDNVKIITLKKTAKQICVPLTHIVNNTLKTGIFPDKLKKSIVIPIHKSGNRSTINNYRPISLLSNISKIFERIIHMKVQKFSDKFNLLSPNQFGFRKQLGTNAAINHLVQKLHEAREKQLYCLSIALDLQKAFDTISYDRLITKLEKHGIRGVASKLIENYLTNRTQQTRIANELSDEKTISLGLPQGTVLAPLFFSLFLNDLLIQNVNGSISAFADDTIITCTAKSSEELQEKADRDFQLVHKWLNENSLTLNITKTNFINFSNKRTTQNFTINNVKQTEVTKYLGVIIDEKLKWESHIQYTLQKLRKTIYKFVQLRNIANPKLLKTVYYALVQSQLQYGITAWGGAFQNTIDKLNVIQRRILKIIHKKPNTFPTSTLFEVSNVLTVKQLFVKESILQVYKNRNSMETVNHNHTTRYIQTQPLIQIRPKTTLIQRQTEFTGLHFYNKLPLDIKATNSLKTFKRKLDPWLKNEIPA